jgi:hypothetical protein
MGDDLTEMSRSRERMCVSVYRSYTNHLYKVNILGVL